MKFFKYLFNPHSQAGDTIVEVMISLTLLSLSLGSAYALSSQSLRTATEANQRSEALSLAQSQVDLLVSAKNDDPTFTDDYQVASAFCINVDTTKVNAGDDGLCDGYNGSNYNIGVSYSSSSQVFTITAQWGSVSAANGTASLNLYYKLAGNY